MSYYTLDHYVNVYALHRQHRALFPYLLESVAENEKIGRYDILFYRPQQTRALMTLAEADFLTRFDADWLSYQHHEDKSIPQHIPFRGGWFVFFSYELAAQIEPTLSIVEPPYPIAFSAKCGAAIIVDKVKKQTHLVADLSEPNAIEELLAIVSETINHFPERYFSALATEDAEHMFLAGVLKSRQYIIDGDVFQVNLSRGWSLHLPKGQIDALYHQLRDANPAPFASSCHLEYQGKTVSILSSSPERLISIRNRQIETRPIAGTRPRSENSEDDKALSKELIGHFKERAEHVMLIDLERNDLGRICKAGSVKVDEVMVIESYAHVHHIVSNVVGQLRDDVSPADAVRAVFPGGTITGCPKVRCMEIICELENSYRGVYTGSLGYVNHNGDMDSNILIRTFACYNDKAEFRAGAGVVYDSVPKNELKETRNKAKGLLKAL